MSKKNQTNQQEIKKEKVEVNKEGDHKEPELEYSGTHI